MTVFLDIPPNSPLYTPVKKFFKEKARWEISGDDFFYCDYVVVTTKSHALTRSSSDRMIIVSTDVASYFDDCCEVSLKCALFIDISNSDKPRFFLENGQKVTWGYFASEHSVPVDDVL